MPRTKKWIENLSKSHLGQKAWNKGLKIPRMTGENHFAWKGNKVGYRDLHQWIERQLGKPNKCSNCGKIGYKQQIHWANKSRNYQRIITDWVRLCAKCHKAYDCNKLELILQ